MPDSPSAARDSVAAPLISFDPARVARFLGGVIVLLVVASIAGQILKYRFHAPYALGFVPKFYVDDENNIPTYFSSLQLLMAAALLKLIALVKRRSGDRFARHWHWQSLLFLGLSVDETASLHETLSDPLHRLLHTGGAFYFAWVIPGLLAVLLVTLAFWRFWRHLPPPTRRMSALAAVLFVTGAIGFEMFNGRYSASHGQENFTYSLLSTIEETLEMSSITLFLYALLDYCRNHLPDITLRVANVAPSVDEII